MAELETVGVVRNAVHLKADTLRLVPVARDRGGGGGTAAAAAAGGTRAGVGDGALPPPLSSRYDIHFSFDATVAGSVTVLCHAREVVPPPPTRGGDGSGGIVAARYSGTSPAGGAPFRTRFTAGLGQLYRQKDLDVSSGDWVVRRDSSPRSGSSRSDAVIWPLIICLAPSGTPATAGARGDGEKVASGEVTYATLVPPAQPGDPWRVRAEKQRVLYEGGMYDMETIYGMQSPGVPSAAGGGGGGDDSARVTAGGAASGDTPTTAASSGEADANAAGAAVDEVDAPGSECVVCLSDPREVFVLPCRHLCLCADCAPDYKRQANRCPICRKTIVQMVRLRPQQVEAAT